MGRHKPIGQAFVFSTALYILAMGLISTAVAGEDETEILSITRHMPTKLSRLRSTSSVAFQVSATGVVAVFYTHDGAPTFFRTSTDGGLTWGPEQASPDHVSNGQASGTMPRGGSIKAGEGKGRPVEGQPGWFEFKMFHFNDDFSEHKIEWFRVHMPGSITEPVKGRSYVWDWPRFRSNIVQLAGGDLITVMFGLFEGDAVGSDYGSRVIVVRSSDQGRTWHTQGTVSHEHEDPFPELPGMFCGFTESSIAQLDNGQLLCMLRSQGSHLPSEYRPLYVSWSDDVGKTWTTPVPTRPHLLNIRPSLVTLDNGVIAAVYGRPGVHVAFSTDDGHTWGNRVSFSHTKVGMITGQVDGRQVAPNRLAVVGGVDNGTWVFSISVERKQVSPACVALSGRVLNGQGQPVAGATVERSPNRYVFDNWNIVPADKGLEGHYHESYFPDKMPDSPLFTYRSIRPEDGHPTVTTDEQGRFQFEDVKLGEMVLTVEAESFAPQHRHINHVPDTNPSEFQLEHGRGVHGRVVDPQGQPVIGACVVLGLWHCHTDEQGRFDWSVTAPVPAELGVKVYKRYSSQYAPLQQTMALSEIEQRPIVLETK